MVLLKIKNKLKKKQLRFLKVIICSEFGTSIVGSGRILIRAGLNQKVLNRHLTLDINLILVIVF